MTANAGIRGTALFGAASALPWIAFAATGSLLGVRETRRIMGDSVLTADDYLAARNFPDEICRRRPGRERSRALSASIVATTRKGSE